MAGKFRTFLNHECQGPPSWVPTGSHFRLKKLIPQAIGTSNVGDFTVKKSWKIWDKKYKKSNKRWD